MSKPSATGGCLCGDIRWRATGAPLFCMICHCRSCRVGAGANAVPWATFRRDDFEFQGEPAVYASSPGVTRTFCARCGTSLTYEVDKRPGQIDVTQGSLDDADALGVMGHVYMEDAAQWERGAHLLPAAQGGGPPFVTPSSRRLRTWVTPRADKGRPSPIAGQGVFATEAISAGEVVEIKAGHIVERAELEKLSEHLQNSEIAIADGVHIAATDDDEYDDIMLYLNHSCAPNVGLRGNIVFVAMRDIAAGEELTVDYAMFDDHDGEAMACACGAASCRGTVTGKDWRLPELQARYREYFSTYLLDKIRALG